MKDEIGCKLRRFAQCPENVPRQEMNQKRATLEKAAPGDIPN